MPRHESEERGAGAAAWVRRWWRALLAETVATALLVWLGVASLVAGDGPVPLANPACAFGFVVVANAVAIGPVSGGHMNPAVTLAALIYGQLQWAPAAAYVLAQCVGAVLGFAALQGTASVAAPAGCTLPSVPPLAAVAVEAALTGLLVLACCGAWAAHDAGRPDHAMPLKLGLTVAGLVFAGGALTGASLNPARSLAPALLHGHWAAHWVYWAGPLGGAALAAALHRFALSAPRRERRARDEELPLDKA